MSKNAPGVRYGEAEGESGGVRMQVVLDLDGGTRRDIATGLPFFDDLLKQMAFHGFFDLGIQAELPVAADEHHILSAAGIGLGRAIHQALSSETTVALASSHAVCRDALVLVAVETESAGGFHPNFAFQRECISGVPSEDLRVFFANVSQFARMTLHIERLAGSNEHCACEAMFKGFGQAIHQAVAASGRRQNR